MIFEKPKHHLRLNACGWSNGSRLGYPVPVAGSLWSTTCGVNLEHQHDSCLAVHDIVKGHFGALAFWEVVGWCGNFVCTVGEVGWDGKLPLAGWVVVMFSLHPIRTTLPRQSRHVTPLSPNSVPPEHMWRTGPEH